MAINFKDERDKLYGESPEYQVGDEYLNMGLKADELSTEIENPEEFKGTYTDQINSAVTDYLGRDKFNYNPNNDATYQQLRDTYLSDGNLAMNDTLASASMLSNGYNNSVAQTAAQQMYQGYAKGVTDIIPTLEEKAYNRYLDDGAQQLENIELMQGIDDKEYGRYRDTVSDKKDLLGHYINRQNAAATVDASKNAHNLGLYNTNLGTAQQAVEHEDQMDYNDRVLAHDIYMDEEGLKIDQAYLADTQKNTDHNINMDEEGLKIDQAYLADTQKNTDHNINMDNKSFLLEIAGSGVYPGDDVAIELGMEPDVLRAIADANVTEREAYNDELAAEDKETLSSAGWTMLEHQIKPSKAMCDAMGITEQQASDLIDYIASQSVSSGGGSGSNDTYSGGYETEETLTSADLSEMELNGDYTGIWEYCSEHSDSFEEMASKCKKYGVSEIAVKYLNGYNGEPRKITSIGMARELIKDYGKKDYSDEEIDRMLSGAYTEEEFEKSFLANYNSQYDTYADYLTAAFSKHIDL